MNMASARTAHILDNRQILHPAIAKTPASTKAQASIPRTGLSSQTLIPAIMAVPPVTRKQTPAPSRAAFSDSFRSVNSGQYHFTESQSSAFPVRFGTEQFFFVDKETCCH